MIYTSHDVFFITLSFCVLILTFFTCWILFYIVAMFRRTNQIFTGFKHKMDAIDEIFKTIKDKVEHSASAVLILAKGVEELISFLRERKSKKKGKEK